MNNLTLIIPAKKESESLPIFINELKNYDCKKIIVLQENDIETIEAIKEFKEISILKQNKNGYGTALIEGINNVQTDNDT